MVFMKIFVVIEVCYFLLEICIWKRFIFDFSEENELSLIVFRVLSLIRSFREIFILEYSEEYNWFVNWLLMNLEFR